jgi:hypothetical protein
MLVKFEHATRACDDDIPGPAAIQLGRMPASIDPAERFDELGQIGQLTIVKQQDRSCLFVIFHWDP